MTDHNMVEQFLNNHGGMTRIIVRDEKGKIIDNGGAFSSSKTENGEGYYGQLKGTGRPVKSSKQLIAAAEHVLPLKVPTGGSLSVVCRDGASITGKWVGTGKMKPDGTESRQIVMVNDIPQEMDHATGHRSRDNGNPARP